MLKSITHEFTINESDFVIEYDGSIVFYRVEDNFGDEYDFYGSTQKVMLQGNSQFSSSESVMIYREVMKFLARILSSEKPNFFSYVANETKKMSLYRRVAQKVAVKHGYYLSIEGQSFSFFKYQ